MTPDFQFSLPIDCISQIYCMQSARCPESLWCNRGRGHKIAQAAITAAGAARSALKTACKDVPLETMERYNLLKHFVEMLPPNNQAVHESAVLARRHVDYYDPAVMAQILRQVWSLAVLCCAVLC